MWQPTGRATAQIDPATNAASASESPKPHKGGLRLKDMAVAMLPLGIWVTGAVAYERIAPPLVEATLAPSKVVATVARLPSLRDERSLLETAPVSEADTGTTAAPVSTATPFQILAAREIAVEAGLDGRLPIVSDTARVLPKGAYLVVRGVSLDTKLSHGIAIGPQIWLVDGADMGRVALQTRAGVAARHALTLQLVSGDGRLLAEDDLLVEAQIAKPLEPTSTAANSSTSLDVGRAVPMVILPRAADEPAQPDLAAVASPQSKPVQMASTTATLAALAEVPKAIELAPVVTSAPAKPVAPRADAKALEAALARGRRMLALGNIAVARPLLERAAAGGSAAAALLMGNSYDANWLKRSGSVGVSADAALARSWYAEAQRLGSGEAAQLIAALPVQ